MKLLRVWAIVDWNTGERECLVPAWDEDDAIAQCDRYRKAIRGSNVPDLDWPNVVAYPLNPSDVSEPPQP